MKKFFLFSVFAVLLLGTNAQFIPKPLNFPTSGYFTDYVGTVDSNTVWVGTYHVDQGFSVPYSNAIRSVDGGNTWQFSDIPETGSTILICGVSPLNADTCYYLLYNDNGGAIWKTENGGMTWTKKTTTQFIGGFANFYHAFTADSGIAGGDPNLGYFEIQLTADGGNSWTRVPSANLPAPLTGEYGASQSGSSSIGNHVWFATNKGRCYHSSNRGLNWTVSQVTSGGIQYSVCFIDSLRGVFWQPTPAFKKSLMALTDYYITTDGGLTWTMHSLASNYHIRNFCSVPGINGGILVCAYDSDHNNTTTVLFSPNFFTSLRVIQTNLLSDGFSSFTGATSGWLSGVGLQTANMFRFTGNLMTFTGVTDASINNTSLIINPNPSSSEAVLCIPAAFLQKSLNLEICDITGKIVGTQSISSSSEYFKLDPSGFSNGIYIIHLTADGGMSGICRWVICHH